MTPVRFSGSTVKEDASFPASSSTLSPQRPSGRLTHTRSADRNPSVERIFIRVAAGEAEGTGDLQENPLGRKGSDTGRGSHFIYSILAVYSSGSSCPRRRGRAKGVGLVERSWQRARGRAACGAAHLALPLRTARRCVF